MWLHLYLAKKPNADNKIDILCNVTIYNIKSWSKMKIFIRKLIERFTKILLPNSLWSCCWTTCSTTMQHHLDAIWYERLLCERIEHCPDGKGCADKLAERNLPHGCWAHFGSSWQTRRWGNVVRLLMGVVRCCWFGGRFRSTVADLNENVVCNYVIG